MISPVRYLRANAPVALLVAGIMALSHPASASAQAVGGSAAASGGGSDLLVNPRATAGAVSAQGWDAVTIPAGRCRRGCPR
jgi:hypothetical protein